MSWITTLAAPAHFVAGLSLFGLAAMIEIAVHAAGAKHARLQETAAWRLLTLIALCLAQWCHLPLVTAAVGPWPGVLLEIVALAAMVELGVRHARESRGGLLPRWSCLIVGALAVVLLIVGRPGWLEAACQLALAWQGGWLTWHVFGRSTSDETASLTARISAWSLVACLAVACLNVPLVEMVAALIAAGAGYVALGPAAGESRKSKLIWRCSWPAAFLVIAAGGCSIVARTVVEPVMLAVDIVEPADDENADAGDSASGDSLELVDADSLAVPAAVRGPIRPTLAEQVKKMGIGAGAILLFVLAVWGLSRLPCVH